MGRNIIMLLRCFALTTGTSRVIMLLEKRQQPRGVIRSTMLARRVGGKPPGASTGSKYRMPGIARSAPVENEDQNNTKNTSRVENGYLCARGYMFVGGES